MPSLEKERQYIHLSLLELEDYLKSDILFWTLSNQPENPPRLTLGGLLLSLQRVKGFAVTHLDNISVERNTQALEHTRGKWRAAWESKVNREIISRLRLWKNYLIDYQRSPENYSYSYRHEIRWRVMIQLLLNECPISEKLTCEIQSVDDDLLLWFLPGDFIWEHELKSEFPSKKYWFLYGELVENPMKIK